MKLFIHQYSEQPFKDSLDNNLDLSIFLDRIPEKQEELSGINIMVLQEPNEYFGRHTWVLNNAHLFHTILTYNDLLLNRLPNAHFMPLGTTWFKPEQYQSYHQKKFQIAHLAGKLKLTYGHTIRHEVLARRDEIKIPRKFYETYGSRDNIEQARLDKEEIFGDVQYGICIENTSHNGYFTEKILDCFLMRTIPVYWGCSNISDFFEADGIITFQNPDDLIRKVNLLTPQYYESKTGAITHNYIEALKYVNYEQNIVDKINKLLQNTNW